MLLADTDAEWNGKITYIGTDNFELGKRAGQLLGSMLYPGDQVALIGGSLQTDIRIKGAREALEAAGIEIVTEQSGYDNYGNIKSVIEDILQSYPDIKGVVATNDLLALNAIKVIERKGLMLPVIGADGIIKMLKYIEKGRLSASIAQNPYDMGYLSVGQAIKAIKGESVSKRIDSGVDFITTDNVKVKLDFVEESLDSRESVFKKLFELL